MYLWVEVEMLYLVNKMVQVMVQQRKVVGDEGWLVPDSLIAMAIMAT